MIPKRVKAVTQAAQWIGIKEHPPGSNHGPQIDLWCKRTIGVRGGFPWCACFVWCMFDNVGRTVKGIVNPALVESWVQWARANHYVVTRPLKGDVVCFDWEPNGWRDHVGLVEKVLALPRIGRPRYWIRTIEGNTSTSNQSNGGEVQRRWRWVGKETVFIRVPD